MPGEDAQVQAAPEPQQAAPGEEVHIPIDQEG